jgi:hypothetical protein
MKNTKRIVAFSLILLFFLPSFAQELKTKKISTGDYLEIFTVDKSSKMRTGGYLKINTKTKDTLISGAFRDDLKTGIWKYNDLKSKPWVTYDFDKKYLTRLSDELNRIDSFFIRKDNKFVFEKVDSPPTYIGYKDEMKNLLERSLKIPNEILENGLSVISIASFVVDKEGKMREFKILKTSTKDVNEALFEAFKKIEGEWSPAIYHGQPIDSDVFIVFDIKPHGTPSAIPKISNSIVTHFEYYAVQRRGTISGKIVSSPVRYPSSFTSRPIPEN